ncbi:hypothetical protein QMN62_26285, partial [Escherichia coli]|nr:hypothetical protein [Escherichia coli]
VAPSRGLGDVYKRQFLNAAVSLSNLPGNTIDVGFMTINASLSCESVILISIKPLLMGVAIEAFCNCINEICLSSLCNLSIIGIV